MFTLRHFLEKNGKVDEYSNWRRCRAWTELLLRSGFEFREFKREGDYCARRWFGKPEEFVGISNSAVPKELDRSLVIPDQAPNS